MKDTHHQQAELIAAEPWHSLSRYTSARIALGRAGASQTTASVLNFNTDLASARDAIHAPLDPQHLQQELKRLGFSTLVVQSRAHDRAEYLRRPDLGRTLSPTSATAITEHNEAPDRITIVIADGLSSLAPTKHAVAVLERLRDGLFQDWQLDDIILATQARVAIGDEIGHLRRAEAVLVLIGERPGLKSPDSLGAYLTYSPRPGRMDSERNCISNIRPDGLSYDAASFKIFHLLNQARALGVTGVALKDDSDALLLTQSKGPG